MYEVKGLPSTRTSTRRSASCGTTSTLTPCPPLPSGEGGLRASTVRASPTSNQAVRMSSAHDDVALRVVEHDLATSVHRGDSHAQRHRVAVAGVDVRIRLLARA